LTRSHLRKGPAIPPIDERGLRRFGLVTGAMFAGLFGLLFPWLLDRPIPAWPWTLFAVLAAMGLLTPRWLRPLYYGWMHAALWLSRFTTPVILGVAFFLVVTPIGLIMRAVGRDPMNRRWNRDADSYRVRSRRTNRESLERPY
jgi:hypothetical protein